MFKFVHISDVHLDSLVHGYDKHRQKILDAVLKSFEKSVDLAISEQCHALLISGDLFDSEYITFNTELNLRDNFKKLFDSNISVFYCLGNHDPATSKTRMEKLGKNVFVFDSINPIKVNITDEDGTLVGIVAGAGYEQMHVKENIAKRFAPIDADVPVVGMLHTSLDKGNDANYAPCKTEDLEAAKYDYWALGHIHEREIISKANTTIVYPGCISGTHWNETGEKGCMLVTIKKNSPPDCRPIVLSDVVWHKTRLSGFLEASALTDIVDICSDALYEINQNGKTNFIRITLVGSCPIASDLTDDNILTLENTLEEISGMKVSVKSQLTSVINPEDYKNDKHLLSIALEYSKDIMHNPDKIVEILTATAEEYKGLVGGESPEYIASLFRGIDKLLCESMLNMDKVSE